MPVLTAFLLTVPLAVVVGWAALREDVKPEPPVGMRQQSDRRSGPRA